MSPFKVLFTVCCFLISLSQISAQVDVKINPLGLLFRNVNAAAEFGLGKADNLGLEVTAGVNFNRLNLTVSDVEKEYRSTAVRVGGNLRYYFNPRLGLDGFYAGAYSRYTFGGATADNVNDLTINRLAVGFLFGSKIVARNERLLFDFGIGFGRALVYTIEADGEGNADLSDVPFFNWDIPVYISIGYRFSK